MLNQSTTVAVLAAGSVSSHQSPMKLKLINPDGTDAHTIKKGPAQADTTAADLAALKVDFNALLLKLRNAGVIASS